MTKAEKVVICLLTFTVGMLIGTSFTVISRIKEQQTTINQLESKQVDMQKRLYSQYKAMQTKDLELENGIRNNYRGLTYRLDWIERQTGVTE